MPQRIMTRLKLQDVKDTISCHQLLAGEIAALDRSNWARAGTLKAVLVFVDQFICGLYNRAEPYWLRYLALGQAQPDQVAATEPNDGAVPELAAPAPESEPGK